MTRRMLVALIAAIAIAAPACTALKDPEPWTQTVEYADAADGSVRVTPLNFQADSSFGLVQVVNDSSVKRGFAIDALAVFETIPPGLSKTVSVPEAKNHHTYVFYDQLHPHAFRGTIRVVFKSEQAR